MMFNLLDKLAKVPVLPGSCNSSRRRNGMDRGPGQCGQDYVVQYKTVRIGALSLLERDEVH